MRHWFAFLCPARLLAAVPLFSFCLLGALLPAPARGANPSEIRVFPNTINLSSRNDRQSVVVQALYPDGQTREVTAEAKFKLADPKLARFEQQTVLPLLDGKTTLEITFAGKSISLPLAVEHADIISPISFKLDVMPVLMKAGCNSGSCHGTSRGKDGFHLSLFGYDPDSDFFALTRENIGRRINLALPEESLVLEKGLGRVPHGGGERFTPESELYQTLLRWLKSGAPQDGTNVAHALKVEIMPTQAVLESGGATQKLTVRATYSDGTDRDITSLAVFLSNNDSVAKVSDQGLITSGQRGEAYVMARFETFTVGAQIIATPKGQEFKWPQLPAANYIDELVYAKLKKLRLQPSELCDDATFVRRVHLDLVGQLPTAEKVRSFVASTQENKRTALIDELLIRQEFAELWVLKMAELLEIRSFNDQFSPKAALVYYNWLRDKLLANVPMNLVVQELLTAQGSTFANPAANYFQVEKDTLKTAENVAQVFMGMRIQCAQCHNHPFDRWTMNDYYSFSAFFAQVGRKPGEDPRENVIFNKAEGEVKHPVGGRAMKPKFLGGQIPEIPKDADRRQVLATWLASPQNPFFAKNLANMIWAHFMGKGIIEPVDDVRVSNPASNPELLETLGGRFTDYKYDFRRLVRDICSSRTYQLSTRSNPSNELDERNFSHASIRRLKAEVLLDCLNQVTENAEKYQGLPRGARSVQIADGAVNTYFLTTFGRATRTTVCSCEVKTEPNLSQALHLLNGSATNEKIGNGQVPKKLLKELKEPQKVAEELYLRCLARPPTAPELAAINQVLAKNDKTDLVLNDLFWALLNSKEFIFTH